MLQASALKTIALSPADTVLDMVENILDEPKMDIHAKLAALRELCLQHISFGILGQAVKIISALAAIITSDPSPEVRVAALEAMEHMIDMEEKAEAEQGKPAIDWRAVNVMLRNAKQQTELDTLPVALRSGAPSPEAASPPLPATALETSEDEAPEAHAASRDDAIDPEEAALLVVQENAVAAVKAAPAPTGPMLVAEESKPSRNITPAVEEKSEPPIMKFLRSVADTDNEEHIRALANRVIAKIENLTALKPPAAPTQALTEG